MKQLLVFILLFAGNSCTAFRIIEHSPNTHHLGYNNCNMEANGEALIYNRFIAKGDIVFDVGACIGQWSAFVYHLLPARIYAFEPVLSNFQRLQMYQNEIIHCFNLALSDHKGQKKFYCYDNDIAQGNFFDREILKKLLGKPKEIMVHAETVESFCQLHGIDRIDFMKIDTEGSEFAILKSAEYLLKNHRIKYIQFEYGGTYLDAHIHLKDMYDFFRQYGYRVYRIFTEGLIYIPKWDNSLENFEYSNYFATYIPLSSTP